MASPLGAYRIRWANIITDRRGTEVRMCIAERRVRFIIFRFWMPVNNWRPTEAAALRDVEYDKFLRSPLPTPRIV